MGIAIYPGSFDPVTLGHLDIIERAAKVFDKLIVCVMHNSNKAPMFSPEERCTQIEVCTAHLNNVSVQMHGGLLAAYAEQQQADTIIKGLRAVSDFEYEFQMALANRKLNPKVETVFLTTSAEFMYLSSSVVKDIAAHGGDISGFVPECIKKDVVNRMNGRTG